MIISETIATTVARTAAQTGRLDNIPATSVLDALRCEGRILKPGQTPFERFTRTGSITFQSNAPMISRITELTNSACINTVDARGRCVQLVILWVFGKTTFYILTVTHSTNVTSFS